MEQESYHGRRADIVRVGTAGWTIPRAVRDEFPGGGSHLQRYAGRLSCAEINSSFYRQHRRAVYQRWASAVPDDFRFSVKVPRAVTHDQRLVATDILLEVFLEEVQGLGSKLGALLVQLPGSHAFDSELASDFFDILRGLFQGVVVCEPRHPTWFEGDAELLLERFRVARAAADPACVGAASRPGGWRGLAYYRLHGSPRMYYSPYGAARVVPLAGELAAIRARGTPAWCIFDNTASGAAAGDAVTLQRLVE